MFSLESEDIRLALPLFTVWEQQEYASREQVNYQENSRNFLNFFLEFLSIREALRHCDVLIMKCNVLEYMTLFRLLDVSSEGLKLQRRLEL